MKIKLLLLLACASLLAACAPTPTAALPTAATSPTRPTASQTPAPSATLQSSATRAAPSATATAHPTATTTAQPSSTSTVTPLPTLGATPTLSPLALSVSNIGQIKRLATWGRGNPSVTAWSRHGDLLAVGTSLGVYLFDGHTFSETRFIPTDSAVYSLAFSPSADLLAIGTHDVTLWNPYSGVRLNQLDSPGVCCVSPLAFSPGGTWLAAAIATGEPADEHLLIWRAATGQVMQYYDVPYCLMALAFSHDGHTLATDNCDDISLTLYDVLTGMARPLKTSYSIADFAFSPDGSGLLVYQNGQELDLLALSNGAIQKTWAVPGANDFRLLPNSNMVLIDRVTNLNNGDVNSQLLDLTTGQGIWFTEIFDLKTASISPDGGWLAAIAPGQKIQIWDLQEPQLVHTIDWEGGAASLTFGPWAATGESTRMVLAVGGSAGLVSIINPENRKTLQTFQVNTNPVSAIALDPTGQRLAIANRGDIPPTLTVLNTATGQIVQTIPVQFANDYSLDLLGLAFSTDSQFILAKTSEVADVQGWNISTGLPITNPQTIRWAHGGDVNADSQGHLITVSVDDENVVFSFNDVFTGQLLATVPDDKATFYECQINEGYTLSADDRYLAMGCDWPFIRVWDLRSAQLAQKLTGHHVYSGDGYSSSVLHVAFSPTGYLLVSSGADDTIRFWDAEHGTALLTLRAHNGAANLELSPNGRFLALASSDGTYDLWGLQP